MKNASGIIMMSSIALLTSLMTSSCLNEAYDINKLNTEVTIGQNGIYLPIGNTEKLKITDLAKDLNPNLLTQINGEYALKIGDTLDLGQNLPDMNAMLNINDIAFNDSFIYKLDNLSADKLMIDAVNINTKFDAGESLNTNITFPQVSESNSIKLGLIDYVTRIHEIDLNQSIANQTIYSKAHFDVPSIPGGMVSGNINIPVTTKPVNIQNADFKVNFQSPDTKITNIRDIKLKPTSKVTVKVELSGHEFLKSGDILPNVELAFGDIFGLKDASGAIVRSPIHVTKTLNNANKFTSSEEFTITSLNIKTSDWKNGVLNISQPMSISGNVTLKNGIVDQNSINNYHGNGDIHIKITLLFKGLAIESARFDMNNITVNQSFQIPISLGSGIELPQQINRVENVVFNSGSHIAMALTPENLNIPNLKTIVNSMNIGFPTAMKMVGSTDGNFNLGSFDIKHGINRNFGVERIDFPASSTPGKLVWDDVINVNTQISVSGTGINSLDFPKEPSKDGILKSSAKTALEVSDWSATTKAFENTITPINKVFKQDLVGKVSEFGTFTVTPAGNPQLTIRLNQPTSSITLKSGTSGVKIEFPKFIIFRNISPAYNFDATNNSITLKGALPKQITMDIDKLKITPEPKEGGVGYELTGEFKVSGSVAFGEGHISKKEVDVLVKDGIKVIADIPSIRPSKVELTDFNINVDETFEATLLKASELPKEIISISEAVLDNVRAFMQISFANLPNLGAGKSLVADLKVTLPKEIVIDPTDSRLSGNTLSIKGIVKNNALNIDPIKISELDLSGYDFSKKQDLKSTIKIVGKLGVNNPDIDITSNMKPVVATVAASIAKIQFSKIRGKVNYILNEQNQNMALTSVPEQLKGENACLDIDNPYLLLKARTNVGVPLEGRLTITPVRKGIEDKEGAFSLDIILNGAENATKMDSTMLFIAAKNEGCPSDYKFIQCEAIKSLIMRVPDELKLTFNAKTSTSKESVIEPQAKYSFDVDYQFVAPLKFGDKLNIELKDTLTGLGDMFAKIVKDNKIQLGGDVTNSLPVQLELNVDMIDHENKSIALACPAKQVIKACASDGKETTVPLDLTLEIAQNADMTKFKGLLLSFKVTSGNVSGIPVTDKCFVQANVSVKLPNGITMDINNLNNQGNQKLN